MATKPTVNDKSKKDAAPKPIRPPRKLEMSLRVQFTNSELLEIGKKLAEANREFSSAENEKKAITATLKAKCDSIGSRIELHSGELTNGYTYRNVPCEIRYDSPSKGAKTTVRLDTNEIISTEAMTLAEMQIDLPGLDNAGSEMKGDGKIVQLDTPRRVSSSGAVVTPGDGDDAGTNNGEDKAD